MNKVYISAAVVGVALLLLFASFSRQPVSGQEKPAPAVQKWEYKLVGKALGPDFRQNESEDEFNKLGAEGWELCAAAPPSPRPNALPVVTFVFKRPKR